MPKIPMDYSKTIMYKIVCNDLSVKACYVGHTTDMAKRKWSHKSVCNNEKSKQHNLKIYKIIRQNGGWSNWSMLLIEPFPCKDNYEACKREREVYEEIDAKMNTRKPCITHEEHKKHCGSSHPKNGEYQKKWRELNRDKYLKQNVKGVLKCYYYKKGIKELMNIDPTLFL